MRILFIITRADTVGGAQIHIRDIASRLSKTGNNVLVVTGQEGIYNAELKVHGINFVICPTFIKNIDPYLDKETLLFLIKTIRQFQPDIVSTHSSKAGVLGRLACLFTQTPCIFTAHGWAFTEGVTQPSRTIYKVLEKIVEPFARKIICVSDHDRHIGLKLGMNSQRLLTIHNGMPSISNEFKADPSKSNPVRIVMVARFDKQKDHHALLRAFAHVSGAKLDLVGDGPGLNAIKKLANELGLTDKINFWGYQSNVSQILSEAQIFTLISNWEGFPRTIIEAMRAGLPVVASNVGGAKEAVQEGVTGYLIERSDVQTLRDRLNELVKNVNLRREMGNKGRAKYEAEFTFAHMFDKTYKVYEEILNTIN